MAGSSSRCRLSPGDAPSSLANYVNTPGCPIIPEIVKRRGRFASCKRTKMVMQFSYGSVVGGPEPTLTTILGHIAQLKPFFAANADVIVAFTAVSSASTVNGHFQPTPVWQSDANGRRPNCSP